MDGFIWEGWRAATCMPEHCFCEAVRQSWIRQPANALSSLAFVGAGLWILGQPAGARVWPYRWSFVLALLVIGLGSAFYHASLSFVGQFWDVLGMYFLAGLMLLYRVSRGRAFGLAYGLLVLVLALALWFVPELRRGLFALVLLGAVGLELGYMRHKPRIEIGWFWAGLGLFTLAFIVWILDNSRLWCAPQSWVQGHALWHLLGAVAAGLVYRYYASER